MFSILDTPNSYSAQSHAGNITVILLSQEGGTEDQDGHGFSLSCLLLRQKGLEVDSSLPLPQYSDTVPASLLLPTGAQNHMESTYFFYF